jgi:hypothetical protein
MGLNSTKSLGLWHSLARSCVREVEGPHAYQLGLYIGIRNAAAARDAYYLVLVLRDSALRRGEDGVQELRPRVPSSSAHEGHLATPSASCWSAVQSSGGEAMIPGRRLGVRTSRAIEFKRLDEDFFSEDD